MAITAAQIALARQAAEHLRDEADFNRSWTDGRRGDAITRHPDYIGRRIEIAAEREKWAAAIDALCTETA